MADQPGSWVSEQAARLAAGLDPAAGCWSRGALDKLRALGFEVVQDVNADHLVSGPSGVFMVETKRREYDAWHLHKAKRQAAKLTAELGVWVTPVICLALRRPRRPYCDQGVWILGRETLADWVTAQRNEVVEPGRLARFADGV